MSKASDAKDARAEAKAEAQDQAAELAAADAAAAAAGGAMPVSKYDAVTQLVQGVHPGPVSKDVENVRAGAVSSVVQK